MRGHISGFTLIEMLGVLAIMALLSAAATVMLGGTRHSADLQDAMQQLQQADVTVRTIARSSDRRTSLLISLADGRLSRDSEGDSSTLGNISRDVHIERLRTTHSVIDFGTANVNFSSKGQCETYAIQLSGAAGQRQWIVCAGLTGQVLEVNDDEVDTLFNQMSPGAGIDAH